MRNHFFFQQILFEWIFLWEKNSTFFFYRFVDKMSAKKKDKYLDFLALNQVTTKKNAYGMTQADTSVIQQD